MPRSNASNEPELPLPIAWEGSQLVRHSLAGVNREICTRLLADGRFDLRLIPFEADNLPASTPEWAALKVREVDDPGAARVWVRHQYPLNVHAPASGRWVIMQPWEYGPIPRAWSEPMRFGADEIWVPSQYVRRCYEESGVPADRIQVIPNGVEAIYFTPPEPMKLARRRRLRLLFVGGTIPRKGADLLLKAYLKAFNERDDVELVVKDFGADGVYRAGNFRNTVRELSRLPGRPAILLIEEDLSPAAMRDLYASADLLVHPYRGEGFGLPVAEAMAVGTPVLVTQGGATDDFCSAEFALMLPAKAVNVPASAGASSLDTVAPPWWLEPDVDALAEMLRGAYEGAFDLKTMGRKARSHAEKYLRWEPSVARIAERLVALGGMAGPPFHADDERVASERFESGVRTWNAGVQALALRDFALARGRAPSAERSITLAAGLLEIGDPRSGAEILRREVARMEGLRKAAANRDSFDTNLAEAYQLLSLAERENRNLPAACEALTRAVRLDASRSDWRRLLADFEGTRAIPKPRTLSGYPAVSWRGSAFLPSGYAEEVRNFVLGLSDVGVPLWLQPIEPAHYTGDIERAEYDRLVSLMSPPTSGISVEVQQVPPDMATMPREGVSVLRTVFETDRISEAWAHAANRFREIWVPTEFNVDTFIRGGVVPEKLHVLPQGFDFRMYDPDRVQPAELKGVRSFRFLSVFDWSARKGWDLLLRAYLEEFTASDDVTLVVKTTALNETGIAAEDVLKEVVAKYGGPRPPHVHLIHARLSTADLVRLYAAANAFVLPTRGEGWGRPLMEAMAMRLPTIATRWSAHLTFMNDANSYLVEIDGLEPSDRQGWPMYRGHLWAAPSVESLREQMRAVYRDRAEATRRAERGYAEVRAKYSREAVARLTAVELQRAAGI